MLKKRSEALLAAPESHRHSAVLSLEIGKTPPREKRLFKSGENDSKQGKFYFSKRSADLVMERAKDWGNRFHFDWDHHAYLTMSKGVKAPAAAWYDLEVREDGLYAVNIDWTPPGKKDVEDESYKYLSPYFDFDEKTREVTQFNNAALTNMPALKQLEALTSIPASEAVTPPPEAPNMERKALLAALGLPETATDAELASRVSALNSFKQQVMTSTGAKSDFEAMTAMMSLKASQDQTEALKRQLEQQTKDALVKEKEGLLSAAVAAGQLEPGGDLKKQLEGQSVDVIKAMLAALPKVTGKEKAPPKGTAANVPAGEGTALLSQEQLSACRKSATWFDGVKPEELQKHWEGLIAAQQTE